MHTVLFHWLTIAITWFILSMILPGIHITDLGTALVASICLAGINLCMKPLVFMFMLPVDILTLGLLALAINTLLLTLAAFIIPGFEITSVLSATVGALILSGITYLFGRQGQKGIEPI